MASMAQGGAEFAGQSAGSGARTQPALLVRGLAVEARASLDRLSDEVAREVLATVPGLAADADLRGLVLDASVADLDELVAVLAEPERPVDGEPPAELMAIVGALVRRGGEPSVLLQAWRLGQAALWRWLLDRAARDVAGPPLADVLALASGRLFARTDAVVDRIVRAWVVEHERWAGGALARRAATVRALLEGHAYAGAATSADLGYELDQVHCAAVLSDDPGRDPGVALRRLEQLAGALAGAAGDAAALMVPAEAETLWLWLGAPAAPDLDGLAAAAGELAEEHQGVALGTPGRGVDGFRHGHAEALAARRVAELSGRGGGVIRYDQVEPVALMAEDLAGLARFVRRALGDLASPGEPTARLRRTLRVWLAAGGSAPVAAAELGVHKNTVLYRVQRAGVLLPRPVEADRLAVELALAAVDDVGLETLLAAS